MRIKEMTQDQCYEMLAGTRLGRLACTRDHQPYVVPKCKIFRQCEECHSLGSI